MPRVKTGPTTRKRRKKWLKRAKGYWGAKSKLYKTARLQVMKALQSSYRERKRKKRTYRSLWIIRINAALKPQNISYSKFIHALKLCGIEIDRKSLSEIAIQNPQEFTQLVELAKTKIGFTDAT